MKSVLIDNEWLSADLPDGFEAVPHDELEAFMGFKYDRMWGVSDTAHDTLICVTWRDSNKLVMKLASEKFFAKQVDETFSKRYRKCSYHCDSFFSRTITGADNAAQGLRFSYAPDGVRHKGEVLVFKRGVRCYTFCYYVNAETAEDNRPTYEGILDSLAVK